MHKILEYYRTETGIDVFATRVVDELPMSVLELQIPNPRVSPDPRAVPIFLSDEDLFRRELRLGLANRNIIAHAILYDADAFDIPLEWSIPLNAVDGSLRKVYGKDRRSDAVRLAYLPYDQTPDWQSIRQAAPDLFQP